MKPGRLTAWLLAMSLALLLASKGFDAFAQAPDTEAAPAGQGESKKETEAETGVDAKADESKEEAAGSARSDEEFKPEEEISEDYPIPLPSDI